MVGLRWQAGMGEGIVSPGTKVSNNLFPEIRCIYMGLEKQQVVKQGKSHTIRVRHDLACQTRSHPHAFATNAHLS